MSFVENKDNNYNIYHSPIHSLAGSVFFTGNGGRKGDNDNKQPWHFYVLVHETDEKKLLELMEKTKKPLTDVLEKAKLTHEFYIGSSYNGEWARFQQHGYDSKTEETTSGPRNNYTMPVYRYIRSNGGIEKWRSLILQRDFTGSKSEAHSVEEKYRIKYKPRLNYNSIGKKRHHTVEERKVREHIRMNNLD